MTVRLGILGAGRIGQVHARAIKSVAGAELVAMAEPDAKAAAAAQDAFGCAIREIDAIITADDIDAILICTPTDTHADLIEKCVRAGKAVFCEKPIDLDTARVRACLAVVEAEKGVLMVGFNRRFDPDFAAAKAAVDAGQIGDVEMIVITSRDPEPLPFDYLKRSGGIFRDMAIHDFDLARWLLGEEVETVQAAASVLVDPEIGKHGDYDSTNAILRTASGKQCVITNSRRAVYGYDQRIEIFGSKGMVQAKNRHEANVELATKDGFGKPPLLHFFMNRYVDAYAIEVADFVAAVRDGIEPPVTGEDGLKALIIADAAFQSVDEARVIKIDAQ